MHFYGKIIYSWTKYFPAMQTKGFNPIQDGLFSGLLTDGAASLGGGLYGEGPPKIRHTYPTIMKLGTVIPYLRKIQKLYKSRDTSLEFY